MKKMNLRLAVCCVIAQLSVMSCNHRELCYDHSHWVDLKVEFDWSLEPDASPRTMVMYLFPHEGGDPYRYEITDINGSIVRVPSGDYDAVAFNGETESLVETGTAFGDFMITTDEESLLAPINRSDSKAPRPEEAEDEPVKKAPETMWSASLSGVTVHSATTDQTICFTPQESTVIYDVVFQNVENVNGDLAVSAAISGVAEGFCPSVAMPAGASVTVPFAVGITGSTSLGGSVTLFGHCTDTGDSRKHILTVYTANHFYYNFDVTGQIHNAPDPYHITIVIDGLRLPDPDDTGMHPEVSEWTDVVNENIDML